MCRSQCRSHTCQRASSSFAMATRRPPRLPRTHRRHLDRERGCRGKRRLPRQRHGFDVILRNGRAGSLAGTGQRSPREAPPPSQRRGWGDAVHGQGIDGRTWGVSGWRRQQPAPLLTNRCSSSVTSWDISLGSHIPAAPNYPPSINSWLFVAGPRVPQQPGKFVGLRDLWDGAGVCVAVAVAVAVDGCWMVVPAVVSCPGASAGSRGWIRGNPCPRYPARRGETAVAVPTPLELQPGLAR